jgi:formate hydrogenlyase subunit 6/NADH:ubiquinone oxidoreductase subunit I
MARPGALAYLAWRALVVHPLKRLFTRRGTALERFRAAYVAEGLVPADPARRAASQAAAACISCGLCETGCDLAAATPVVRALGLHAAFRLYSRTTRDLELAGDALERCAGCAGCDALCPVRVPIARVLAALRGTGSPPSPPDAAGPGRGAAAPREPLEPSPPGEHPRPGKLFSPS